MRLNRDGSEWVTNGSIAMSFCGRRVSRLRRSARRLGVETDKAGRVFVEPDLTVPGFKNIFVIGDMAMLLQENGEPVPGVSPAAMQMGRLAAANIMSDLKGEKRSDFTYVNKGTMATIGRSKAIADIKGFQFKGFIAWLMWLFLHVIFLIGFRNRFAVMFEWFWAYLTRERSARLITGDAEGLHDVQHVHDRPVNPRASVDVGSKDPQSARAGS